jgi:hypothetical protein
MPKKPFKIELIPLITCLTELLTISGCYGINRKFCGQNYELFELLQQGS